MKKIAKANDFKLQTKTKALRINFSNEDLIHETPKFKTKS